MCSDAFTECSCIAKGAEAKKLSCESACLLKERTRQQLCHFTTQPPTSFQGIT
jgi:hypothetical protein